ncbi:unnamed protein product [Choristocarpus tenellus]
MNLTIQVHYPSFSPQLLLSAGNDRMILLWDHRAFAEDLLRMPPPTQEVGPSANLDDSSITNPPPLLEDQSVGQSGVQYRCQRKKKGGHCRKARKGVGGGREMKTGEGEGSARGETSVVPTGLVDCSTPVAALELSEKPNWVTSAVVPYESLLLADTSSSVKVFRKSGGA